MRNCNIGSRTPTGTQARHTLQQTATTIHLDRACLKDVVKAAFAVVEALTEVKDESKDGPKLLSRPN
jgi:hypothetical protein